MIDQQLADFFGVQKQKLRCLTNEHLQSKNGQGSKHGLVSISLD